MKKKSYKTASEFYKLGRDYSENHFGGILGEYLLTSLKDSIEFMVKVDVSKASRELLIYIVGMPALFKQEPQLVIDFLANLNSVKDVAYEADRKETFTVYTKEWNDFIEEDIFNKTTQTHLRSVMKKEKKKYGIE